MESECCISLMLAFNSSHSNCCFLLNVSSNLALPQTRLLSRICRPCVFSFLSLNRSVFPCVSLLIRPFCDLCSQCMFFVLPPLSLFLCLSLPPPSHTCEVSIEPNNGRKWLCSDLVYINKRLSGLEGQTLTYASLWQWLSRWCFFVFSNANYEVLFD